MPKWSLVYSADPRTERLLAKNRISDNVGGVNHFLSTRLRALRKERHFALVDELCATNPGSLVIYFRFGHSVRPMHLFDHKRQELGRLVENTICRIEAADFLPHSGIRFPQNPCSSCAYVGLCLEKQNLVEAALVRRPGAENLGWLDELAY
jgi:hypothetical protein